MSDRTLRRLSQAVVAAVMLLGLHFGAGQTPELLASPKPKLPPIYDTQANGGEQIAAALAVAKREHKRVLLQFGANWCIWCHRLHAVFDNDKALSRALHNEYELVLIDMDQVDGRMHNADIVARYGQPTKHGLPTLVVLDAEGRQLTTRETASWEVGDGYDHAKIMAFLQKWQATTPPAEETLSAAIARAKSESKHTFLWFGAPWCAYCNLMDDFLHNDQVGKVFGSAFVPVKIDVDRMAGGKAVADRYGRTDEDGLPFFVILDGNGQELAHSRGPKGNVGFPVEPFEIEHFMKVVKDTAGSLTPTQLAMLDTALKNLKPEPDSDG